MRETNKITDCIPFSGKRLQYGPHWHKWYMCRLWWSLTYETLTLARLVKQRLMCKVDISCHSNNILLTITFICMSDMSVVVVGRYKIIVKPWSPGVGWDRKYSIVCMNNGRKEHGPDNWFPFCYWNSVAQNGALSHNNWILNQTNETLEIYCLLIPK